MLYYKLNQVGYLTNTFHFTVGQFSHRPQMSNCDKKKKCGTEVAARCVTDVSPHFDVTCDLLLTGQTVT